MIRKILLAVMLAAGLSSSAFAQATFTAKDASGSTQTFKSFNCSANVCSLSVPADITGAAFGVTANPFFVTGAVGAFVDGWDATQGTKADAAWDGVSASPTMVSISKAAVLGIKGPIPAGSALIGDVNVRQGGTALSVTNPSFAEITDGTNSALVDPCQSGTKVYTPINVVTATNTIITGVAAKKKYICGMFLYPAGTDNIAIFQATTGTSCATALVGVIGGTTTATGIIATAQAGFVLPTTGYAHAATTVNQTDLCIVTSAAVQLSGVVVTVDR